MVRQASAHFGAKQLGELGDSVRLAVHERGGAAGVGIIYNE